MNEERAREWVCKSKSKNYATVRMSARLTVTMVGK